jgi:Mur ligase middle domain
MAPLGSAPRLIRPRIPVVAITGTNGKTTTARMIGHIARRAGRSVGWSSTDGVYINGEQMEAGGFSGPGGAGRVLAHPGVELAVTETARGGILRRAKVIGTSTTSTTGSGSDQPDRELTSGKPQRLVIVASITSHRRRSPLTCRVLPQRMSWPPPAAAAAPHARLYGQPRCPRRVALRSRRAGRDYRCGSSDPAAAPTGRQRSQQLVGRKVFEYAPDRQQVGWRVRSAKCSDRERTC